MERPLPRRGLLIAVAAMVAAAFVAPRVIAPPQLREGRVLAAAPHWRGDAEAWRGQADAYVADRFPARPYLIGLLNRARLAIRDSGSARVLVGRGGWLFYNDGSLLGPARGVPRADDETARRWLTGLAGRVDALQARGVPYLVIAPPTKETIYPQQAPAWFRLDADRRAKALADLARLAEPGRVLMLHDALAQATAAGAVTFSRHDTHWTGDGAYAGYVAVMGALRAQGLDQPTRPLSAFVADDDNPRRPRDLALMLGVASFTPIRYRAYADPASAGWKTTWLGAARDFTAPQVIDTGASGKPVLLMQRDSFSNALLPFLAGHFSRVVLSHIDDGFWRPDLVERFHPDFVLLEVQEAGLASAMADAPPPSPVAQARIAGLFAPGFEAASPAQRQALDSAAPAAGCAIDGAVLRPEGLALAGWISDLAPARGSYEGFARLTGPAGDVVQSLKIDLPRGDLAAAYGRPVGQPSGFFATLNLGRIAPGAYRLRVYRRAAMGWMACDGPSLNLPR